MTSFVINKERHENKFNGSGNNFSPHILARTNVDVNRLQS